MCVKFNVTNSFKFYVLLKTLSQLKITNKGFSNSSKYVLYNKEQKYFLSKALKKLVSVKFT